MSLELVPEEGLEPSRGCPYRISSPLFGFSAAFTMQYPAELFEFQFPCCLVVFAVPLRFGHNRGAAKWFPLMKVFLTIGIEFRRRPPGGAFLKSESALPETFYQTRPARSDHHRMGLDSLQYTCTAGVVGWQNTATGLGPKRGSDRVKGVHSYKIVRYRTSRQGPVTHHLRHLPP